MAKGTGSAGRATGQVNPVVGPDGKTYYRVGGEQGRVFSSKVAAERYAKRNKVPMGEIPTLPVMRKGKEVGRRRMTLAEIASNGDFTNLKVNDRVELRGFPYTVTDVKLYGSPDLIQLRSEYNSWTTHTREDFIRGGGRKRNG